MLSTTTKSQVMIALRRLRLEIEREIGDLSVEQACLLDDVCQALGLEGNDCAYVLGDAMNRPAMLPIFIAGSGIGGVT